MRVLLALLLLAGVADASRGRALVKFDAKQTIRKRIKRDLPAIFLCFEQHDTTFPRLEIKFTIGAHGTVTKLAATGGGSKELERCVTRVFKKMRFAKSAASTQVTYPLQICVAGQ